MKIGGNIMYLILIGTFLLAGYSLFNESSKKAKTLLIVFSVLLGGVTLLQLLDIFNFKTWVLVLFYISDVLGLLFSYGTTDDKSKSVQNTTVETRKNQNSPKVSTVQNSKKTVYHKSEPLSDVEKSEVVDIKSEPFKYGTVAAHGTKDSFELLLFKNDNRYKYTVENGIIKSCEVDGKLINYKE